jgi:hypothetical protein
MLEWVTKWRERRTAQRLRAIQLEHRYWISITAMDAIRAVLICADRKRTKGQDTHDLFMTITQIVDLWERDTSPRAWRTMLVGLQERGAFIHDHAAIDRPADQPGTDRT